MSYAVGALAALGEAERAKEWAARALLLDPDNLNLRYNFACTLVTELHEFDAALDLLEPAFEKLRIEAINWVEDRSGSRRHPRSSALQGDGGGGGGPLGVDVRTTEQSRLHGSRRKDRA